MNRSTYSILFSVMTLLTACATPDTTSEPITPTPNPYLRSLDIAEGGWQQLKSKYGSSYRYINQGGSVFGPTYETTLIVENDTVVQRDLQLIDISDAGETTITEVWTETGDAVGSHKNSGAAEPVTVETLYEACRQAVDHPDIASYEVYLSYLAPLNLALEKAVIIASCDVIPPGYVQDGGSTVTELEFLN